MSAYTRRRAAVLIKLLLVIGAVVAVTAGVVAAFSSEGESQIDTDLYIVKAIDFDVTSTASGQLEAKMQTKLRSEVEGRSTIVEIVDEGTTVEEGDLLVRLSDDEIQKSLDNEMLNYESAKSALISAENALSIQISDNESALRKAELTLELAQLDLKKWEEGDVVEKRRDLDLAIERGERDFERTTKKYERSKQLFEEQFLSEDQRDLDEIAFIEAESKFETAKLQKEVYETYTHVKEQKEKRSAVNEAEAELERVKSKNSSQLANKEADLSKARQTAAIREEQVRKLEEQIVNTSVYAPTDGLVVYATSAGGNRWRGNDDGPLQVGREIRHNEELIILPDTKEMMGVIKIHESLVSRISKDLSATVIIDAVPGRVFEGKVASIGIVASDGGWRDPNNREYDVKILLDCDGNEFDLKPSMRCEAEIVIEEVRDAIAVPITALFSKGSTQYVYIAEGGRYPRVPVETGSRSETYVQITSGLEAGDRVLMHEPSPSLLVKDDALAKLDQASDAPGDTNATQRRGGRRGGPTG